MSEPESAISAQGEAFLAARWRAPLVAFLLVLACHSWRLGEAHLSGTEGHRALPAHRMVVTGDWLVPRFYNQVYLTKPPMHYWVLAVVEAVTGRADEWVWRLPSALSAAGLAAFLAVMARRWFGPPAGWVSGLSFMMLAALWSQSRSANIGSQHTAASVAAGLCLLEIGFGPPGRRRWLWSIAGAASLGALLLIKGPSGLPLVLGAPIGGSLFAKRWRWLLRPSLWLSVLGGAAVFGAWALAVYVSVRLGLIEPQEGGLQSGVAELKARLFALYKLPGALLMVVELLAYSLPLSLVFALSGRLFREKAWRGVCFSVDPIDPDTTPDTDRHPDGCARRCRALVGAFVVGLAIFVINGVANVRYVYILLPLLCLLAGAAGAVWASGGFRPGIRATIRVTSIAFGGIVFGAHVYMVVRVWEGSDVRYWLIATGVLSLMVMVTSIVAWARRYVALGFVLLTFLFVLLSFPFADYQVQRRDGHSAWKAAQVVKATVPAGTQLVAREFMYDKPELFLYAGFDVLALTRAERDIPEFDNPRWLVLAADEWPLWQKAMPGRLVDVTVLPMHREPPVLVRYVPEGGVRD